MLLLFEYNLQQFYMSLYAIRSYAMQFVICKKSVIFFKFSNLHFILTLLRLGTVVLEKFAECSAVIKYALLFREENYLLLNSCRPPPPRDSTAIISAPTFSVLCLSKFKGRHFYVQNIDTNRVLTALKVGRSYLLARL